MLKLKCRIVIVALLAIAISPLMAAEKNADEKAKKTDPDKPVMAYVNGEPIYMEKLIDLLLQGPGPTYAQQLVRQKQVQQVMDASDITLTKEEVKEEAARILEKMVPEAKSEKQREEVLQRLLKQKQVSREQWMSSVRLAAALRKLAEPHVNVTEKMLRKQFGLMYGEKVVVREIKVESLDKAQEIQKKLDNGEDFSKLAFQFSTADTAQEGGLREGFTATDKEVPTAIRQAAMSLKEPGETSEMISTGGAFYILKLERIVPPEDVKFEDVKHEVEPIVQQKVMHLQQRAILEKIVRQSKVEYVNPMLRREIDEGSKP